MGVRTLLFVPAEEYEVTITDMKVTDDYYDWLDNRYRWKVETSNWYDSGRSLTRLTARLGARRAAHFHAKMERRKLKGKAATTHKIKVRV